MENNNWSLVSETGLPEVWGAYWTITEGKEEVEANTFGTFGKEEFTFSHAKVTHYQPIIKPSKPIY